MNFLIYNEIMPNLIPTSDFWSPIFFVNAPFHHFTISPFHHFTIYFPFTFAISKKNA